VVKGKNGDIVAWIIIGEYDAWHKGFPGGWLPTLTLSLPS